MPIFSWLVYTNAHSINAHQDSTTHRPADRGRHTPTDRRRPDVKETFVDIVIPDDERPTGRLVPSCSSPAGHNGGREHNPGFPTSQLRTSGVIESGGSC